MLIPQLTASLPSTLVFVPRSLKTSQMISGGDEPQDVAEVSKGRPLLVLGLRERRGRRGAGWGRVG